MATIQTSLGPVSGFVDTHVLSDKSTAGTPKGKERPVDKYLGLPFGEAGRWAQASSPAPWSEPRKCHEYGPASPQLPGPIGIQMAQIDGFLKRRHLGISETNILTLNIFASHGLKEGANVPVMIWIYGGSWKDGAASAMIFDATTVVRASKQPIIVVSVNYRTNLFGFLAAEDLRDGDGLVGNYGLRDQLLGLKWVKANIHKFGGSSDNITIFGESAGAASVAYHIAGRDALFKRAIAQSGGSATMSFIPLQTHERTWQLILKSFQIDAKDKAERVRQAKAIPMKKLLGLLYQMPGLVFSACPEQGPKAIWTEHPAKRIARGEIVPSLESFMSGVCTDEGLIFAKLFGMHDEQARIDKFLKPLGAALPMIRQVYKNVDDASKHVGSLESHPASRLLHDALFEGPVIFDVENLARLGKFDCYLYRSNAILPAFHEFGWGIHHASEIPLVFNTAALWKNDSTTQEAITARNYVDKWISFAATGKPADEKTWPAYTQSRRQRYVFENGGTAKSHLEDADLTPAMLLQDGVIKTVAGLEARTKL